MNAKHRSQGLWQRALDFVAGLFRINHSIETLTKQNKDLDKKVLDLQREVDRQSGQLDILIRLIHASQQEQPRDRDRRGDFPAIDHATERGPAKSGATPRRRPGKTAKLDKGDD